MGLPVSRLQLQEDGGQVRVRVTSEASTAATRPTSTAGMVPGRALERALSLGALVATACLTVITLYSAGDLSRNPASPRLVLADAAACRA